MITTRDLSVLDFLNEYKIASTSTLQQLIYGSQRVCQRRLKVLHETGRVKRIRNDINSEYIYYIKMPKQWKHSLLITEFYREFSKKHEIIKFSIKADFKTMRPDAFFAFKDRGKLKLGFLEVEISNKGFDFVKYEKFAREEAYRQFDIPFMPTVYVVGKPNKFPESEYVKYIKYEL